MLDQHGRLSDYAGKELLVVRQLDPLPFLPFVLVSRVRGLECVTAGSDLEDNINDILELHVMHARAHIDAVAGVEADTVGWDPSDCRVKCLHTQGRPLAALGNAEVRPRDVVGYK